MKRLLFLFLTLIPLLTFSQKAKIEFEKTSHDFDCRFFIFLGQLLVYWGINRIFAPFKEYFNLKD